MVRFHNSDPRNWPSTTWAYMWDRNALAMEQHNSTGRVNISKDQLLGESEYAELQMQILFDDVIFGQCLTVDLNVWDKVEQQWKQSESFTKKTQGSDKAFSDFLQWWTLTVNRAISDPDSRAGLIESLAFKKLMLNAKGLLDL